MYRRGTETFKNPIQLVRPLSVNLNRKLDRNLHKDTAIQKHRPRTGGLEASKRYSDFRSNSTSTNFSFESDYDTDFEDDIHEIDEDMCISIYKHVCQTENIVPVKKYIDNYRENQLSLRFYGLGPKSMKGFIPSLTMNQFISELDLSSNGLGDEGIVYLSHILRDNCTLTDINLSHNFITIDGIKELCELFKQSHILIEKLKLNENLLNDECARLLSEVIANSGRLHTLSLAGNQFESASGFSFGYALEENTSLRILDLQWNAINRQGAVALIKGILKNEGLQILNLSHNGLGGGECGLAWYQALKENKTLIHLDLSYNHLTAEPATHIGRGLVKSECLQTINLTGNPLESAGCYAIIKPLIGKNLEPNKLKLIDISDIRKNSDFRELYNQVKEKYPELEILIGSKIQVPLVKNTQRVMPTPIERLHTLLQRRPNIELNDFFFTLATSKNENNDDHITDFDLLKREIHEKLHGAFSDEDIRIILNEISEYDCKKFVQKFDNRPITASLSSSSWRFKS